jgi:hypothetical protein
MPKRVVRKAARIVAKIIVTIKPEVVRASCRTMHVVRPAAWVWQMRPGAQAITGVNVGMQVLLAAPAMVVVVHHVVGICEVVKQTRGAVVAVTVTGEGVVVMVGSVEEGVVVGAAEVGGVVGGVEGCGVVESGALEGVSVVKGGRVVFGASVVGTAVVFGAAAVFT